MKNLTAIQQERVRLFKNTLNKSSKWYAQDLRDFIDNVSKETASKSKEVLSRVNAMNSKEFELSVAKEERKMEMAGLYELSNMKPKNALD